MFALKVRKEFTEEARRILFKKGLVDKKYVFLKNGDYVEIPLKRELEKDEMRLFKRQDVSIINKKLPSKTVSKTPFEIILEKAGMENKSLLPKKWEIVGDVLILKIPKWLEEHEKSIAKIYADVLKAKTVVKDEGIIGRSRKPKIKVLYGSITETIHKENKIKFKLDVSKVMFSSGNIDERIRTAYLSNENETVVDMFAGIGYFSVSMAFYSKPKRIFAYEINPDAYHYLRENINLNNVQNIVKPVLSDNRNTDENIAERVIMGYLKNTKDFLPKAFKILKADGGIIHYHENYPNELLPKTPFENIKKIAVQQGKTVKLLNFKNVKSYAPGVGHVVLDVKVT
jgi:tRNA wybutosine-synthesizing protein 2